VITRTPIDLPPMNFGPTPRPMQSQPGNPRSSDFDALADLFLADHDTLPTPPCSNHSCPRIEAVLMGHLPVLAAAWAGQYARLRAQQLAAPVAVLRLTGQWIRVELVGSPTAPAGSPGANIESLPRLTETGDLMSALATAVGGAKAGVPAAAGAVGAVLVCTTASDEARLIAHDRLHDVTLLTSADEASTVAAYRVIKTIASDRREKQERDSGSAWRPGFRLVVAGSDQPAAIAAWRRLGDAARTFLGVELELAGTVPQIAAAVPAVVLYDGPLTETMERVLAAVHIPGTPPAESTPPLKLPNVPAGSGVSLGAALAGSLAPSLAASVAPASRSGNGQTHQHGASRPAAAAASGLAVPATPVRGEPTKAAPLDVDDADDADDIDDEADRIETARALAAINAMRGAGSGNPATATAATAAPAIATAVMPSVAAVEVPVPASRAAVAARGNTTPVRGDELKALGLTATRLSCPLAADATFATDALGALHVVAGAGSTAAEHEAAIVTLLRAGHWAQSNAAIIGQLLGTSSGGASPQPAKLVMLSRSGPLAREACIAGIHVYLMADVTPGATTVAMGL
jgi:hypothetical protein